jgi:hypothetical protein
MPVCLYACMPIWVKELGKPPGGQNLAPHVTSPTAPTRRCLYFCLSVLAFVPLVCLLPCFSRACFRASCVLFSCLLRLVFVVFSVLLCSRFRASCVLFSRFFRCRFCASSVLAFVPFSLLSYLRRAAVASLSGRRPRRLAVCFCFWVYSTILKSTLNLAALRRSAHSVSLAAHSLKAGTKPS